MNNILKAAKLDFSIVKPYLWNTVFVLLFPVVFSIMNKSLIYGVSFTMCFIGMTMSYTFSISEKNGMERLFGILPIPKKHMVLGRYFYTCATGLLALLFSIVVYSIVLYKLIGIDVNSEDFLAAALTGIIMFTGYTVFSLPAYYKFGVIKGRFIMLIPVALYLLLLWLTSNIDVENLPISVEFLNNPIILVTAVLLVCIIAFLVSVFVSIKIFQNKEV